MPKKLVVLVVLAAGVMAAPSGAMATATKSCPNVTVTNEGGSHIDLGVKATGLLCSTAKSILQKAWKTDKDPAGWTFSDTEAKFNSKTNTTTCGFAYKKGSKRIAWHVVNDGPGCG